MTVQILGFKLKKKSDLIELLNKISDVHFYRKEKNKQIYYITRSAYPEYVVNVENEFNFNILQQFKKEFYPAIELLDQIEKDIRSKKKVNLVTTTHRFNSYSGEPMGEDFLIIEQTKTFLPYIKQAIFSETLKKELAKSDTYKRVNEEPEEPILEAAESLYLENIEIENLT